MDENTLHEEIIIFFCLKKFKLNSNLNMSSFQIFVKP